MIRFLNSLLMISLLCTCLLSQSEFLPRGQSGFGITTGIGFNKEATKHHISAGYSYQGFIDFDIAYSKANGGRVTDAVITPTLTYFFIKQEDLQGAPSIGVSAGYNQYKYITKKIISIPNPIAGGRDTLRVDESDIKAFRLGITAHRRVGTWRSIFYQPFISGTFSFHSIGWNFIMQSGLAAGTKLRNNIQLFIMPVLDIEENLFTFSLNISIVV